MRNRKGYCQERTEDGDDEGDFECSISTESLGMTGRHGLIARGLLGAAK